MPPNKSMFINLLQRGWFWFFEEPLKDPPPPPPEKLTRAGWLWKYICSQIKDMFSIGKKVFFSAVGCCFIYWVITSVLLYFDMRFLAANDPASFAKFMAPKTGMAYRTAVRKQETTLLVRAFVTEFLETASADFEAGYAASEARYAGTGKDAASKGHRADPKEDEAKKKAEIQPPWYPPGFEKQSPPGRAQSPNGR